PRQDVAAQVSGTTGGGKGAIDDVDATAVDDQLCALELAVELVQLLDRDLGGRTLEPVMVDEPADALDQRTACRHVGLGLGALVLDARALGKAPPAGCLLPAPGHVDGESVCRFGDPDKGAEKPDVADRADKQDMLGPFSP